MAELSLSVERILMIKNGTDFLFSAMKFLLIHFEDTETNPSSGYWKSLCDCSKSTILCLNLVSFTCQTVLFLNSSVQSYDDNRVLNGCDW